MQLTKHGFEAGYNVERLDSRPQGGVHEFRRSRHGLDAGKQVLEMATESLWFKVSPLDSKSWIGGFECGPGGVTGLFATPSRQVLCVVTKGQGYWISVLDPANYEIVRSIPIQDVITVPGERKLVFVDHTRLAAYGPSGFLWLTDDLSWDGLTVTEITADTIRGTAWDSPANREVSFSVDTELGASEGGSSPTKYGVRRSSGT